MRAPILAMLVLTLPLAVSFLSPANASDNDDDPPYMIYIDPQTGKYTRQNPAQESPPEQGAPQNIARAAGESNTAAYVLGALALLVAGVAFKFIAGRTTRNGR